MTEFGKYLEAKFKKKLKLSCKGCSIGGYIQANFYDLAHKKARCTFCIDRKVYATELPMRELQKRLNEKNMTLFVEVFYPSVNNFCPKCGEMYDDGKAYKCPICGRKTIKHFTKKIKEQPTWYNKHEFNELYDKLKKVYFKEE